MKKMMILSVCIILVIASTVLTSYGEMQKIGLSEGNLSDLKGKWVGSRSPRPSISLNTDLEIFNDNLPVQAKLTQYNVRGAGKSESTMIIDFKAGRINDKGDLSFTGGNFELELSLYKDGGKMKLEGNYYSPGGKGTMSLNKK